jgi:DNA-binding winged helix-turn-helix (wHTH) protein/tetratricopeptide (TPR) repeat protein
MKSFGPFRLDAANQSLWRGDTRVPLMPKPFAVLQHLVDRAGRLVTQDQLLAAIWPDTFVQPEVLRRYILEVRRALDDQAGSPRFVQTFPKRGYQFIAEVIDHSSDNHIVHSDDAEVGKLVGRANALADLRRHLAQALTGRRQVIFLVGEPGIGKTSLTDAFQRVSAAIRVDDAGDGVPTTVAVARGQSVEGFGGKEPYYPLLEAIGRLARGPYRTLVVDTLATYAPTWLIQFPSLMRPEQQAALQREILGATRERMVRELCEALEVITQTMPLVLILEDLHWVDHSTLDVISAIARRREPARLLVLGTLRPAELILSDSPLKALKQDLLLHRLSHEVVLERLQEADVAAYVAAGFAPGELPAGFAALIYRHSDGNPLFMTAMIDHLAQRGVLAQASGSSSGSGAAGGGGRWRVTVPLEQVDPGVPDTLKQMLEMQLRDASDAEQQLLTCASVAGQHFTTWSLATMLECDAEKIEELCEALVERQQFLKSSGRRELPNGRSSPEYHFRHSLYREVLYRRLKPTPRETFHRRLAEGLEGLRPTVEPEMAAEIALHFEEGCEYERAVKYLLLAAHNASRRYAHAQAILVLERARELVTRVEASRRQELDLHILERIGNAYHALGDIERSVSTYRGLATQAADAGLLTAIAEALVRRPHALESIPFFERALEIDPTFGSAYVSLSRIYSNLGEAGRAREYARKAYEWRYSVAGDERLSMAYQYHYEVTGDQARATETLEQWKQAFPLDFRPVNSLTVIHNFLGRFKRAIAEGREAVARNPAHGYPYSNLAHAYRGSGRFADARQVAEQAVAREVETLPTRRLLYQLAVMAGDAQDAVRHLDWSRDQPREFDMIGARAQVHGWFGRVASARQLYEDTVRVAEMRNLPDVGTGHLAWALSMELVYGYVDAARELARRVLARGGGYDPRLRAAFILAATGRNMEAEEVEAIVRELTSAHPDHTLINEVLAPLVVAAAALGRGQPDKAIDALRAMARYELGFIAAFAPVHLRGQAYLMLGDGRRAAAEFQRILDHRGTDPFSAFHAVAPLGLGRAYHLIGNFAASLDAYERFFTNWAQGPADANVPVLLEARVEYDALERTAGAGAGAGTVAGEG